MRSITNSCSLSNEKFQQNAAIFLSQGCREKEADRDRGAGDQEEGEGADGHGEAARRGRGVQGADRGRGHEVRQRLPVYLTSNTFPNPSL